MNNTFTKKYKRSIRVKNEDDLKPFIKSLGTPTLNDWLDVIEDHISTSKKRINNKFAMFLLQLNIGRDLMIVEASIKNYTDILNNPEKIKDYYPDIDEVEERHIKFWEDELSNNKIISAALKTIGDGILWRLLDYNVPLLYAISDNEDSGVLHQGKINEISSMNNELNSPNIKCFIHTAITNSGRISDVVSKAIDNKVEFIELKGSYKIHSSKVRNRITRQIDRLDNLAKLANEGKGKIGEQKIFIKDVIGKPELLLGEIEKLIYDSKSKGIASALFRPYLGVVIYSLDKDVDEETFMKHHKELNEKLCINSTDKVYIHNSIESIEFVKIRTPYSIYPFDASIISEILLGKIMIEYILNIEQLFREFEKKGWTIVSSVLAMKDVNPKKDPFCTITNGHWKIEIPPATINRIMIEGMSIESILDIYDNLKPEDIGDPSEAILYNFKDENKIWQ